MLGLVNIDMDPYLFNALVGIVLLVLPVLVFLCWEKVDDAIRWWRRRHAP